MVTKKIITTCFVLIGIFSGKNHLVGQTFYDIHTIQKIEIFFNQSNWDQQLDSLKATTDGYLKADSVGVNGVFLSQPGVKYKGNSSYDSTFKKNPFTISLDKYKNRDYQGYTSIKLSNCYQDPSMIREVLGYAILKNYMACPKANFAEVYINNKYMGLYSNIEDISKTFCAQNFYGNKSNTFIKCNPIITPGPNVKSNLKYLGADSNAYSNYYELKSNAGMNELVDLCSTATYMPSKLPLSMDMDRFVWMLAFNNLLINLDSYSGAFSQNYFIYKDNNGIFNPIMWDLNMCFGGFPFSGSQNNSLGTLSIANMKQYPINHHESDPYWPMINAVMADKQLKKKYIAHMKTMLNEMIVSGSYNTLSSQLTALIDVSVKNDSNKFFTTAQYLSSATTDISAGAYTIPAISNLMSARANYLAGLSEFSSTAPAIFSPVPKATSSFDSVHINVTINDATYAYIGSRLSADKEFIQTELYDDGMHGDGGANDHIYGNNILFNYSTSEFYIYAENNDAGTFLPPRAEYEFLSVKQLIGFEKNTVRINNYNISPNPCNENLNISFGNNQLNKISITDLSGKLIYNKSIESEIQINTQNLSNGIYLLHINYDVIKICVTH